MKDNLGNILQKLRKESNFTAKDVVEKLQLMGYSISDKTLSGYETGIRMPNADVFMALCQIYNCKNILEMFSFVKADYSIPTDEEWCIVEKYRLLDSFGKETVQLALDRETVRTDQLQKQEKRIEELEEIQKEYLLANAAHDKKGATEEEKEADNASMDDEEIWKK